MRSAAYRVLSRLAAGDEVPVDLYVLDYRDGARPRWTVEHVEPLASGGRKLVLVDPDNGADDLFDDGRRVHVTVITWPGKTLRTQPYQDGPGNTLCDLDQQGRAATKRSEAETKSHDSPHDRTRDAPQPEAGAGRLEVLNV